MNRIYGLIDFTSGLLVANIGHDNRRVMRAVRKAKVWAKIPSIENPIRKEAEETLLSTLPPHLNRVAFYNSGSEAMDAAIRIVGGTAQAHPKAFHGSTAATQTIERTSFDWPIPSSIAIIVETFLGPWCEWHSPEDMDFVRGHTVIFDEMQAGFGRTGKWWGFQHYDIEPDMVVGGKAIAGGFPMAFVAGRAEIMDDKKHWETTFSGNALSCAACVATIKEIRRRHLVERAQHIGEEIRRVFPDAQGKGAAMAFLHPDADGVVDRALERGLLLLRTGRGTVKICPPLTISWRNLRYGLRVIKDAR